MGVGGEIRAEGKGESCVKKMRWRRKLPERKFGKIIAGWVEELACFQKTFQPTIPDSRGQVSGNKFNYRGRFIIEGGYSNEFK